MYCPHCGAQVAIGSENCVSCGKEIGIILPHSVPSVPAAPGSTLEEQINAAMPAAAAEDIYAGFWKRVGACTIDGFVVGIPCTVVLMMVMLSLAGAGASPEFLMFVYFFLVLFMALVQLFYYVILESSSKQATVGKMALGIIVTSPA